MIFAIPRRETVYIGTTDTLYNKSKDRLRVKTGEVSYLIKSVNKVFKSNLKIDDVVSSWVGLRPLIKENKTCLLYTSPSPRDMPRSRMPSSA